MQLFRAYNHLLQTKPIKTKAFTTLFTWTLGDYVSQNMYKTEEQKMLGYKHDWQRTMSFGIIGFTTGPIYHMWYGFLVAMATRRLGHLRKWKQTMGKVAMDQAFMGVSFNCYVFLMLSAIQTQSLERGVQDIEERLWTVQKRSWGVWIGAQIINFHFIPLPYRVLFGNCVGLSWVIILSYLTSRREQQEQQLALAI